MAKPLVDDRLWELIAPLLPVPKPRRKRYPGRKRIDDRRALAGIIFVLKTGIGWEDLPQELGCGSGMTCWRRQRTWLVPTSASRIANVSVRSTFAAAQTLIVGFTVQGGAKPILVRAVGPGLAQFNVAGFVPDPRLALFKESTQVDANDNWGGTAALASALASAFASVGAFALINTSLDAALLRSLEGGHTAQVTGTTGGTVLVEAYDSDTGLTPRLVNVSARNRVGTGSNILIAGFTVTGAGSKGLLIRAVGPKLADFGVTGLLADPKLEIYNAAGVKIAENDTWAPALASAFGSVGAFALNAGSKDAALSLNLPPGSYTAQVSGADGGTGEALVEIYELP